MATNPVTQNNSFAVPTICCEHQKLILIALEVIGGLALTGVAVYLLHSLNVIGAAGAGFGGLLLTGGMLAATVYCLRKNNAPSNLQPPSSQPIIEVEPTIIPVIDEKEKEPDIKGTVHIHSIDTGPIREDQTFQFRNRIKNAKGEPIFIAPDDFYIHVDGNFTKGNTRYLCKDPNGIPYRNIYLPSSLFKFKEGNKIQFYYDDQLVELICDQNFEAGLNYLQGKIQKEHIQCMWSKDTPPKFKFKEEFYESIVSCKKASGEPLEWADFSFAKKDEEKNGSYKPFEPVAIHPSQGIETFDVYTSYVIPSDDIDPSEMYDYVYPSEIFLVETQGYNGQHQLWIIIPHVPETNQIPKNAYTVKCGYSDGHIKEWTPYLFKPQNGDRLSTYHHGRYLLRNIPDGKTYECGFNSSGWFQLKFN